ncbi:uncharacterized protein LOC130727441 isoform X2 [Lotus japonicus]|uniref:uncharacterized protein LOC130727441 isoform X2 n=1 Tax=Lotus japonicus TaxID=34305 RepID=UPI00259034F4|nr:uncharacterized protein LOC130727441 isoform X2 [Lotus japonicus]
MLFEVCCGERLSDNMMVWGFKGPQVPRWDIIAEKLGFMLVFGDLVWIDMTQCRQRTVQKMWKTVIHGKSLQRRMLF